jgi:hypothetical protein
MLHDEKFKGLFDIIMDVFYVCSKIKPNKKP